MIRITFPVALLRATARYDPHTGFFASERWMIYGPTGDGHSFMRDPITGTQLAQHRAAYAYMTGYWPPVVDHINRRRSDNRWRNLRGTTHRGNSRNTSNATRSIVLLSQGRSPRAVALERKALRQAADPWLSAPMHRPTLAREIAPTEAGGGRR